MADSDLYDNRMFADNKRDHVPDNSSSGEEEEEGNNESDDQFVELPKGTLGRRFGKRIHADSLRSKFLKSIRRNDVAGVKKTLQANPDEELYKSEDSYGTSTLEHAVLSKSTDIVETILESYKHPFEKEVGIRRATLLAIRQNDVAMVDFLLDQFHDLSVRLPEGRHRALATLDAGADLDLNQIHIALKNMVPAPTEKKSDDNYKPSSNYVRPDKIFRYTLSVDSVEDAQFTEDMSPIVLACQLDRVEIVNLLFEKCSPDIHPLSDKCNRKNCFICTERRTFMGRRVLERSRSAIEVFKALASPAFLLHSAIHDPVLEAFRLSDLMQARATADPSFCDDYKDICIKSEEFAVELLSLCRTGAEVQVLLSKTTGVEKATRKGVRAIFPRLMVALHFGQKQFVAHPHCQQLMENAWYEGLPDFVCKPNWHTARMALYGLILFLLFPILVPLYMVRVPMVDRFLKPAAQRFLTDTVSYFFFILILTADLIFANPAKRDELPTVLEWLVLIWCLGFMARYIKMTTNRKQRWFNFTNIENSNWKFYDLLLWLSFLLKFLFKFIALGLAKSEKGGHPNDRRTWSEFDPFLWSEMFYALGCIIALTQVYGYFKASRALGPLQLTMKKMMIDVLHFLILFGICISAFAFGLTVLYRNYEGYHRYDLQDSENDRYQRSAFVSLRDTYKTLFWSLFNYGDPEYADIVVGNEDNRNETVKHKVTEGTGYVLYGAYNVVSVIVLLNMLIAMMANSYDDIVTNSDAEWKYARARMRMSYFNEIGCIPPPFNLIPLRKLVKLCSRFLCCRCTRCERCCDKKNTRSSRAMSEPGVLDAQHKDLVDRLRRRYWKNRFAQNSTTTDSPRTEVTEKRISKA